MKFGLCGLLCSAMLSLCRDRLQGNGDAGTDKLSCFSNVDAGIAEDLSLSKKVGADYSSQRGADFSFTASEFSLCSVAFLPPAPSKTAVRQLRQSDRRNTC